MLFGVHTYSLSLLPTVTYSQSLHPIFNYDKFSMFRTMDHDYI